MDDCDWPSCGFCGGSGQYKLKWNSGDPKEIWFWDCDCYEQFCETCKRYGHPTMPLGYHSFEALEYFEQEQNNAQTKT